MVLYRVSCGKSFRLLMNSSLDTICSETNAELVGCKLVVKFLAHDYLVSCIIGVLSAPTSDATSAAHKLDTANADE